MRHPEDKRRAGADVSFPLEDSNHVVVMQDRRIWSDRRLENLDLEERQMLFSEMPWMTFYRLF